MILSNQDEKGIHYGVIPKRDLFNHAEEFYENAKDMTYEGVIDEITEAITNLSDYLDEGTIEDLIKTATENFNDHYENDNARMLYEKDGYIIQGDCDDPDLFVIKSPFYTFAPPCSPCAPGAGYLMSATKINPDGPNHPYKTYCLDDDWFDKENPCPYTYLEVENHGS